MIQNSFEDKVEDRIRADDGIDNIIELYQKTVTQINADDVLKIHERIIYISGNLNILLKKKIKNIDNKDVKNIIQKDENKKIKKELIDIKPLQSSIPTILGVGVLTVVTISLVKKNFKFL